MSRPACRLRSGKPETTAAASRPSHAAQRSASRHAPKPGRGHRRSVPVRPWLQGLAPRGESVALRRSSRPAGARCSPGFQPSTDVRPRLRAAVQAPRHILGSSRGTPGWCGPKVAGSAAPWSLPRWQREGGRPEGRSPGRCRGTGTAWRVQPDRPEGRQTRTRRARMGRRGRVDRPESRRTEHAVPSHAWVGRSRTTRRSYSRPRRAESHRGRTETGWLHFREHSRRPSKRSTSSASSSVRVRRSPGSWFRLGGRAASPQQREPLFGRWQERAFREERLLDTRPEPGRLPCR